MIISTLLLCGVNFLYIYLFFSLKARDETIREDSLIIQKLENDEKQNSNTMRYMEDLQSWKHDMRKHLQSLLYICQSSAQDRNDQIISYLTKIQSGLENTKVVLDTGNPMFDNIIGANCIQAADFGIVINLELVVPPLDFIDSVDLCSILGNMWENAIEGCQRAFSDNISPSPLITFKTYVNANHFIMSMSNSSTTPPNTDFSSTKAESGHGIGIKTMKRLVDKYHGICDFEAQERVFFTHIALPINTLSADEYNHCVVFNWRNDK